ncbi:MAG: DMT family transporter [Candidatus Sungbacteria bacterium]|nr:DMT family transporter [Candidatus Sungbacteria bacterium]
MMGLPIYGFVMGGALLHAISNIIKKKLLTQAVHEDFVTVVTMLGAACAGFSGSLIFYGTPNVQQGFWIPFAITAFLNVFIQYLNIKSLKLEDASIVVPLSSAMPMFAILMSYVILGEWPTAWGRVGIVLIGIGAYTLYLGGKPVALPKTMASVCPVRWQNFLAYWGGPWFRLFASKGARLALLVAYLGAISISFDKLGVLRSDPMFFTGSVFTIVACVVFFESMRRGVWQKLSKEMFWRVFMVGMMFGVAACMYNAGYYYGIAPYVGALKRTQILWTVLLAFLFLGEGYFRQRIIGSAVLFLGTILLSL